MKKNLTEVVILTDRSGSMSTIKKDMEGGLKSFIEKQKEDKRETRITHYQFDDSFEKCIENVDIQKVENIFIDPRGSTALFDAIGKLINEVGDRLALTKDSDRPELVLVVIITDGEENSSGVYSNEKIKEMIKHQESEYSWKFIYLGANQDAFATGQRYGVAGASSMSYNTNSESILNTFNILSSGVCCLKASPSEAQSFSFSKEQRGAAAL